MKKMIKIGLICVILAVLVMGGWYVAFVHFGMGPAFPFLPEASINTENMELMDIGKLAENPLMALVDTKQEAEQLAEQYGITLVSFADGVAVYDTDEDPQTVVVRGQQNGYAPLYLNYTRTAD